MDHQHLLPDDDKEEDPALLRSRAPSSSRLLLFSILAISLALSITYNILLSLHLDRKASCGEETLSPY
ncbi:MAG: hypothetical protein Q9195_008384, partial [Heterodermia aff. obscurata]